MIKVNYKLNFTRFINKFQGNHSISKRSGGKGNGKPSSNIYRLNWHGQYFVDKLNSKIV